MVLPRRNLGRTQNPNHINRHTRVGVRPVTQLPEVVLPPAFDCTASHQRTRMGATGGNLGCTRQDWHGRRSRGSRRCCCCCGRCRYRKCRSCRCRFNRRSCRRWCNRRSCRCRTRCARWDYRRCARNNCKQTPTNNNSKQMTKLDHLRSLSQTKENNSTSEPETSSPSNSPP